MPDTNTTAQLRNGLASEAIAAERHLQAFLATAARYVFAEGTVASIDRQADSQGK